MRFEWDEDKRKANLREHRIDFAAIEDEKVFEGETASFLDDRFDYGERRFLTLGLLKNEVVAISHTETDGGVRLISVRRATKYEAEIYFQEVKN